MQPVLNRPDRTPAPDAGTSPGSAKLSKLPPAAPIHQLHHYAYRAKDAEETRHFYEDILGLPLYHIIQSDYVPARVNTALTRIFSFD